MTTFALSCKFLSNLKAPWHFNWALSTQYKSLLLELFSLFEEYDAEVFKDYLSDYGRGDLAKLPEIEGVGPQELEGQAIDDFYEFEDTVDWERIRNMKICISIIVNYMPFQMSLCQTLSLKHCHSH